MKIAIIPKPGTVHQKAHGANKRIFYLAQGLQKKGHQVKLFASSDSEILQGVEHIKWEKPRRKDYVAKIDYVSEAIQKSQDVDIINCQADHLSLPFSIWSKPPILHTLIYGRLPESVVEFLESHNKDYFLTISNFLKKRYPGLNYQGTIYNALDKDLFPYTEEKENFFLYLARISQDKQNHLAIEWAKKYSFKLYLAGPINDQKYFEERIEPFLDDNVIYLGNLHFDEKIKYLSQARATFMLDDMEGFGNSTIESLACGTPVIGFNNGAFPEIVEHMKDGYILKDLEDIKNAIKFIGQIKSTECRKKIEQRFDIDQMVDEYEKMYLKIIEKHENRNR